jgi:hypothetical protein
MDHGTLGVLLLDTRACDGSRYIRSFTVDTGARDGSRYIRSFTVGHMGV